MSSANKSRGKYRFNIIDILLIVVIVVSLVAIAFLFFYNGSNESSEKQVNTVDIIYTVEQTELPTILRGKVNRGDGVMLSRENSSIGQVIDVEYTDTLYTGYDEENNRSFEAVYPGKINMRVKISAQAVVTEEGFYSVDGQLISAGTRLDVRYPFYTGEMVCISVSEVSE